MPADYFVLKFEAPGALQEDEEAEEVSQAALAAFQAEARGAMVEASRILLANTVEWAAKSGLRPAGETNYRQGQPPFVGTGKRKRRHLFESFDHLPIRVTPEAVVGGIKTDDPGAARVEWGATDSRGIRTYPHPFMNPAAEESEEPIGKIFDAMLEDV